MSLKDRLSKLLRVLVGALGELLKLGREMLVIPGQIWLFFAEVLGGVVLRAWRLVVVPIFRAAWRLVQSVYRLAARYVTPARAVAAVAVAAAVALAASQWLDYRSVTVGNDAYSGGVEAVAPAPGIGTDRAGEAHAWVMIPLAIAAIACVVAALLGRRRAPWVLFGIGIAAIVITVAIDAPKGLDEGSAARDYEGAEAILLEGFWVQIAAGGVLAACGLILPAYLRPSAAPTGVAQPKGRSASERARALVRSPWRAKATGPGGSSA